MQPFDTALPTRVILVTLPVLLSLVVMCLFSPFPGLVVCFPLFPPVGCPLWLPGAVVAAGPLLQVTVAR